MNHIVKKRQRRLKHFMLNRVVKNYNNNILVPVQPAKRKRRTRLVVFLVVKTNRGF